MSRGDRAATAAATVLLVGFAWLWVLGQPGEGATTDCTAQLPEGSGNRVAAQGWPPGTQECVATLPDGSVLSSTIVPWSGWLSLTFLAAAAYLLAGRRRFGAPGAAVLAFAALAAYFVV